MKESYLFDMSFNNVVFTGRNKSYGAYELRKDYSKHIAIAGLLAISVFASGLSWPLLKPATVESTVTTAKPEDKDKVVILGPEILPPPEEKVQEPQPAQPTETKVRTIEHTPPKVVPNDHQGPEKEVPTVDQLKGAIIGTHMQDGEEASTPNLIGIENGNGIGTGEPNAAETNTVYDYVADMPYFEGGEEGLMRYISKKIKYPKQAISEQVEGVVVVSFVVNRYGKVTDATILKGLGYGTDEEALRVINSLPDWTPGRQNGKNVAVRYNLPIRFNMKR